MVRQASGRERAILVAILALALVLRIVGLDGPLWYDEILTLDTHLRLPWVGMMRSYSMNHHYLYALETKAAMALLGESNAVLRLWAMLFGVGGIALTWALARQVTRPSVALAVALLLAVSYHHIWFSQNARGYTELAFWCTAGLLLFVAGLERPHAPVWLGFGVVLALAVATHLTGAIFFAALGLVWIAVLVRTRRAGTAVPGLALWPAIGGSVGVVLSLAFYAPVLPSLLATVAEVSETSAVDAMVEYQNPLWTLSEAVRSAIGGLGGPMLLIALAVIALAVLGGASLGRRGRLVAWAVLVHVVLSMVLLNALGMRIWPRFFFSDIGFLMILIVAGVAVLCDRTAGRRAGPAFAFACVAMVGVSAVLASRNYSAPKQDLAGAYERVQQIRRAGEPVYALGHAATAFTDHFAADWTRIDTPEEYRAVRGQSGAALFVLGFPQRVFRRIPELDRDLEAGDLLLEQRFAGTLGDGAVLILRR